jgi:acyl-CoA reductase-like NAD-dependent aldehyde dehydrogenase
MTALLRNYVNGKWVETGRTFPNINEEEAVARANHTDYGLCASIWTQNLSRGHRVAHAIAAGLVG